MSISYLIGLLVLAVSSALGQVPASAPHSPPSASATTTFDEALEQAILERFAKSKISTNNFSVKVSDGVAFIAGKTDVAQHKGTATRLAKAAGAARVENQVELTRKARDKLSYRSNRTARRVKVRWVPRRDRRYQ